MINERDNIGHKARRFIMNKPLSEDDKDAFVFGCLSKFWQVPSDKMLTDYYANHYAEREESEDA